MANKNKGVSETMPQKYQHNETKEIVKTERVNTRRIVVHFAAGSERISEGDLRKEFTHLGEWRD